MIFRDLRVISVVLGKVNMVVLLKVFRENIVFCMVKIIYFVF